MAVAVHRVVVCLTTAAANNLPVIRHGGAAQARAKIMVIIPALPPVLEATIRTGLSAPLLLRRSILFIAMHKI
jgi:hypothetical protein